MKILNIPYVVALAGLLYFICNTVVIAKEGVATTEMERQIRELLPLSLTELLSISVASKREERWWEAPGIVNVISQQEIARYGARDLNSLLRRLPSVFPAGGFDVRENMVSVRGQFSSTINKHLLILLNGRPLRDPFASGLNTPIYRSFPIDAIERLEFVRGPGSVLYGSSAFAGVINIVTKKPQHEFGQTASISYGSFDTRRVEYALEIAQEEFNLFAAGQIFESNGYTFSAIDEAGVAGSEDYAFDDYAITAQVEYKGFTFNLFNSRTREQTFDSSLLFPLESRRTERSLYDIGYIYSFADDWKATLNLSYGGIDVRKESIFQGDGRSLLGELTISGAIKEQLNLLAGITYENQQGTNAFPAVPVDFDESQKSIFFQIDYKPWDFSKFILGAQFNSIQGNNFDLSPRLGVILDFNSHWGAKLLYSEAFRSPSGFEQTLDIPGVFAINSGLDPERIATYDAQFFYHSARYNGALTFFYSKQTDNISVGLFSQPGLISFQNLGKINYRGVELEGSVKISNKWYLQASVSYQENENQDGVDNIKLVPNFMAKLGATYDNGKGLQFGIFNSYFGQPTPREEIDPTVAVVNPSAPSFHYLTINASVSLNQVFNLPAEPAISFSLYGDNLLESDPVHFPDVERGVNTLPIFSGRAINAKLKVEF